MNFLAKLWNSIVEGFKNTPLFVFILLAIVILAPSLLGYVFYAILGVIALVILAFAIFAWRLQRMQRQMHEQFRQQGERAGHQRYNYNRYRQRNNNEGDVSIHTTTAMPEKKISDDVGEYVDFKEEKNSNK
jgi:membrane protein implicated in regulation of membrane protease activity